jgi:hypothetical protein
VDAQVWWAGRKPLLAATVTRSQPATRPARGAWRLRRDATAAVAGLLAAGERVLAAVRCADGTPVVGTERALYHRDGPAAGEGWRRLGWEQVGRVDWDRGRRTLVLTGAVPEVPRRTVLRLGRSTVLVGLARERVGWTTLARVRVWLGEPGEAQVTIRRQPGTGELSWVVALDPGVDRDDPHVSADVSAAIAGLRAELGL